MSKLVTLHLNQEQRQAAPYIIPTSKFYSRKVQVTAELHDALMAREKDSQIVSAFIEKAYERGTMRNFDINDILDDQVKEVLCLGTKATNEPTQSKQDSPAASSSSSTASSSKKVSSKKTSATKSKPSA